VTTVEGAFDALRERGLGVLVTERSRPTAAEYALGDCDEVREFLARLAAYLDACGAA
jgi:hypothetical protein